MKKQLLTQPFSFVAMVVLLTFIIVAINSCQKENTAKTSDTLTANTSANSSIIYTDLNPDKLLQGTSLYDIKTYHLDLNNDGKTDYDITTSQGRGPCARRGIDGGMGLAPVSYVQINCYGTNGIGDTTSTEPVPLNKGRNINQTDIQWNDMPKTQTLARYVACSNSHSGLWSGAVDKYLALRILVGVTAYYGWIRLDVGLNGIYFTIKDYAFNNSSGQTILAGQTK